MRQVEEEILYHREFRLKQKNVSAGRITILWTFGLCRAIFDRPMKRVEKRLEAILFAQNISKNINLF